MKLGKRLVLVVGGLLVVLVVALVVAFVFIDRLARTGIQAGATYALGVPTTLDQADVGVFAGTFEMRGLQISNPQGFASDKFMTLGKGGVAVSLGSLSSDTVELPKLELDTLNLALEKNNQGSNYQVLLNNLKRFEDKSKEKPAAEAEGKKFVIREVLIRKVTVKADIVGGMSTTVPIEQI